MYRISQFKNALFLCIVFQPITSPIEQIICHLESLFQELLIHWMEQKKLHQIVSVVCLQKKQLVLLSFPIVTFKVLSFLINVVIDKQHVRLNLVVSNTLFSYLHDILNGHFFLISAWLFCTVSLKAICSFFLVCYEVTVCLTNRSSMLQWRIIDLIVVMMGKNKPDLV